MGSLLISKKGIWQGLLLPSRGQVTTLRAVSSNQMALAGPKKNILLLNHAALVYPNQGALYPTNEVALV